MRRAEAAGGFGAILRKGDPDRGALLLVVISRGTHHACLERTLSTAAYGWQSVGPVALADPQSVAEWTSRKASVDPDLWLIELDIAEPERFIAETTSIG